MKREDIQKKIYYYGLILLVISLPFSLFSLSLSMLILTTNWLFDKRLKEKIKLIYTRKSILVIITIYLVHLIGLLNTANFDYALHDLRIKLPILALPVIIGTSEELDLQKTKTMLQFFVSAVVVSTLISFLYYLDYAPFILKDNRNVSVFISHIRFSLLVDISIFVLLYLVFFTTFKLKLHIKIICLVAAFWLSFFLLILESFTGIVIFLIVLPVFIFNWSMHQKKASLKFVALIILILGLGALTGYFGRSYQKFYSLQTYRPDELQKVTINGNLYTHDLENSMIENGNYIGLYICEKELRKEWNQKSGFPYDSLDKRNQEIKYTLIRYMTSKGLRKDSAGIAALTQKDIRSIENGFSNYIFQKKLSLYPRIYQLIWELDVYSKFKNPSGHSITQRIEFLKNGFQIIKRNFWTGVGTGDVADEFQNQYEINQSPLGLKWRLRAHNQYVTFILTFGIVGFLWIVFAFIFPVLYERKEKDFLTILFLLIAFLSMINEDTLETHVGISFFAFFYSFFIFGYKKDS